MRRLHGVGPVTAARLEAIGLSSAAQLAACDPALLAAEFRHSSAWLLAMANGIDDRPVQEDRQRKSLGAERTFDMDLSGSDALTDALIAIVDDVWLRNAKAQDGPARTVTLKLKFADFRQITRSHTLDGAVADKAQLLAVSQTLLMRELPPRLGIRLMGVTLSSFAAHSEGLETIDALPLFAAVA